MDGIVVDQLSLLEMGDLVENIYISLKVKYQIFMIKELNEKKVVNNIFLFLFHISALLI